MTHSYTTSRDLTSLRGIVLRWNSGKVASRSPGTSCAALRCMHQSISLSFYSNVTSVGAGEEAKHIQWARRQLNSPGSVVGLSDTSKRLRHFDRQQDEVPWH